MDSTIRIEGLPGVTHGAGHAPYIEALRRYLSERGHAAQTARSYGACASAPPTPHAVPTKPCKTMRTMLRLQGDHLREAGAATKGRECA